MVYYPHLVDFYGFHVGKYFFLYMDGMGNSTATGQPTHDRQESRFSETPAGWAFPGFFCLES